MVLLGTGSLHGYEATPWVWGHSLGMGPLPGYGATPSVWVHFLGMGHMHAMCWSSVTMSAKIGKAVSQSLPLPPTIYMINWQLGLAITLVSPIFFPLSQRSVKLQGL